MVNLKKQISIILILSFSLSLIPNFLYNEDRVLAGCPNDCDPIEKNGETYCINCPISCQWGMEKVTNKSCLPLEETGEWPCGIEIPIGEVMDRTAYLAGRMLAEFGSIVKGGRQMVDKTDELLTDYKDWSCDMCQTECYKYFYIIGGELQPGQDPRCPAEARYVPRTIPAGDECKENPAQCQSCAECGERCCWEEEYSPDPEHPEETITCGYCRKEGLNPETEEPYCQEICVPYSCMGCCWQYFGPIINGYSGMEDAQKSLENDIKEKTPEGENLPEDFKFKRSYILEQLDFARCELAQCWIPAEDYPDVLVGEKVGKHLLTCEKVSQMGLFEDDQLTCLTLQVENEWEEIKELWGEPKSWWEWPVVIFQIAGKIIKLAWRIMWDMIEEWFETGQEEGCYPTNYYCCQF